MFGRVLNPETVFRRYSVKKGVLKNLANITGKNLR